MPPLLQLLRQRRSYWTLFLLLAALVPTNAQEAITVTGVVTAQEDAGPLPGMTVILKNTSQGADTDASGKYSIKAPIGSVLEFRGVRVSTNFPSGSPISPADWNYYGATN